MSTSDIHAVRTLANGLRRCLKAQDRNVLQAEETRQKLWDLIGDQPACRKAATRYVVLMKDQNSPPTTEAIDFSVVEVPYEGAIRVADIRGPGNALFHVSGQLPTNEFDVLLLLRWLCPDLATQQQIAGLIVHTEKLARRADSLWVRERELRAFILRTYGTCRTLTVVQDEKGPILFVQPPHVFLPEDTDVISIPSRKNCTKGKSTAPCASPIRPEG